MSFTEQDVIKLIVQNNSSSGFNSKLAEIED